MLLPSLDVLPVVADALERSADEPGAGSRARTQAGLLAPVKSGRRATPSTSEPTIQFYPPAGSPRRQRLVNHPQPSVVPKSTLQGQAVTLKTAHPREAVRWRTQRTDLHIIKRARSC